jgi:hypothetical protein
MAWWTVWRGKRTARAWGIAASLIYVLIFLSSILYVPRAYRHPFWAALALGVAGLVAFWRPYPIPDARAEAQKDLRLPGDGTNVFLNKSASLLMFAACYFTYSWWMRWLVAKSLPEAHSHWNRSLWRVVVVVTIFTTLHELGHTLTGLALGIKLRAFVIGPLQCRIRDGKWHFRFNPTEILSGGGTGVVPATADFPRWRHLSMLAAGPLVSLVTGGVALWIAFTATSDSPFQAGGLTALFGAWSLALCTINMLPFRTKDSYSDGARAYQLLSDGPWADFHHAFTVVGSSLVTPLRPRDYDIGAIHRAALVIKQGTQGLLLRLYAHTHFLDQGRLAEAGHELKEAESIYHESASNVPAELHTVFVFGR